MKPIRPRLQQIALCASIFLTLAGPFAPPAHASDRAPEAESIPTIEEYFRTAPLYLVGRIRFEKAHRLFHSQIGSFDYIQGYIQANKDVNVRLDRTSLQISTHDGLRVAVAGIPINVTKLSYNNQTGDVEVRTSLMGLMAGNALVERQMAEQIRTQFRPKLQEAFARLLLIRQQKTLAQAGDAINAVIDVFNDHTPGAKPGEPLPTFTGDLSLVTKIAQAQTVNVGQLVVDLQADDILSSSVLLRVPMHAKAQFRGLMFSSALGLLMHPPGSSADGVKVVNFKSFSATETYGFQLEASNGADDLLTDAGVFLSVLRLTAAGVAVNDSTPLNVQASTLIEGIINAKAQNALQSFTQTHRQNLLKAGATPALVDALSTEHDQVGAVPFMSAP